MNPRYVYTCWMVFEHEPRVRAAGTREYTAAELDAIADFSWPLEGLFRALVTGLQSLRIRWARLLLTRSHSPQIGELPAAVSSNQSASH